MEELSTLKMKMKALQEGYSERFGDLTVRYEDRIADLRILLTEESQKVLQLQAEVEHLRNIANSQSPQAQPVVVESTVVSDVEEEK